MSHRPESGTIFGNSVHAFSADIAKLKRAMLPIYGYGYADEGTLESSIAASDVFHTIPHGRVVGFQKSTHG